MTRPYTKIIPRPTFRRRVLRRRHLRHVADSVELASKGLPGRVINISETGIALETKARPVVSKTYHLELSDREVTVEAIARVRWSVLRKTAPTEDGDVLPVYAAGLKFEEVDEENLHRLIERVKRRRRARF